MKYKVGDKVRLGTWERSVNGKKKLVGKIATIDYVGCSEYPYSMNPSNGYSWCDAELTPVADSKIVITVNGSETLARLYEGNTVIKSASAKCSPEDTFDFSVGAKIAFERLMGIEPKNEEKPKSETESTSKFKFEVGQKYSVKGLIGANSGVIEITKVDGQRVYWKTLKGMEDWVVSKSFGVGSCFADCCTLVETIYKPGDKVKIIGNTCSHFASIGEIITLKNDDVNQSYFPKESHKWTYEEHNGYICEADFEPYVEPKYYNGKVVCISSNLEHWKPGKVYEIKDGVITDDDGMSRNAFFKTFDEIRDYFGSINSKIKFIPFVE